MTGWKQRVRMKINDGVETTSADEINDGVETTSADEINDGVETTSGDQSRKK
jgi:hypothetical protein